MSKAPITWTIVMLSVALHITTSDHIDKVHEKLRSVVKNKEFLNTQGKLYSEFINRYPEDYDKGIISLNKKAMAGDKESIQYLAALSLNDGRFLSIARSYFFTTDRVAYKWWKQNIASMLGPRDNHPRYIMGVNQSNQSLKSWITYQFSHSNWMHLLTNMIILVLFGAYLERAFGGFILLGVYLASGFIGAGVFSMMSAHSAAPLIGASGSVTGVIGFLCIAMWKKPIRFVYLLMVPVQGYIGFVSLPAWVAYALWLMKDLTAHLAENPLIGQDVAYEVHLGGLFCGTLLALSYIYLKGGIALKKKQTIRKLNVTS